LKVRNIALWIIRAAQTYYNASDLEAVSYAECLLEICLLFCRAEPLEILCCFIAAFLIILNTCILTRGVAAQRRSKFWTVLILENISKNDSRLPYPDCEQNTLPFAMATDFAFLVMATISTVSAVYAGSVTREEYTSVNIGR
jgi:hypothetical protein